MLATIPAKCECDKTKEGCDYKKWFFENAFKEKLPQMVRNSLVGTKLNINTPSAFVSQADELLASASARQIKVSEVKDTGGVGAVGNRGSGKTSGNKKTTKPNICDNHKKY